LRKSEYGSSYWARVIAVREWFGGVLSRLREWIGAKLCAVVAQSTAATKAIKKLKRRFALIID